MMTFWNHPLIMLLISIWAIGRGSAAVAAEIERGTMDLILSRPVARSTYLASQVLFATGRPGDPGGRACLRERRSRFITTSCASRRRPRRLVWPALNLAALGLPIYGYTLLASSLDHVRWRPTSIGSVLTLGGIIAYVVSMIPVFEDSSWKPWLERISIFKAYNPIELVDAGETFAFNLSVLTGLGAAFIVAGLRGVRRARSADQRLRSRLHDGPRSVTTTPWSGRGFSGWPMPTSSPGADAAWSSSSEIRRAMGASVRNFGMLWPIGQPFGPLRQLAVRSLQIWLEVLAFVGLVA